MNEYDTRLDGRKALVTGGGSGIGAAIAATLRSAGAEVRTCDIDPDSAPDYVCDVSDDEAVAALFASLTADLGGVDICINNVGIAGPTGQVEDMDPTEFDRCVQINIGGTYRVARHAIPLMRSAGHGSIVNISSTAGHWGYPLRTPYAASKWAIEGMTKTWAMELGRHNIRVNCIAPGTIAGPRMSGVIEREAAAMNVTADAVKASYEDQVSMRTFIDASDIAAMATFLCSDAARFINGEIMGVDGNCETLRTAWPDESRVESDIEF
jgi:NAD(P)-dependent dehydrogenase (short-subunit alcohol dehydrogenase family)